jgi:hypothetical protein
MNKLSAGENIRYPNRWPKGVSGNYRGRPKVDPRIRRMARANIEAAVIALTELSIDSKANDKVRFLAGVAIFEAAMRTNLLSRFMKNTGMSVARYLLIRPSGAGKKEDTKTAKPPSEQATKLIAARNPRLVDSVERIEQEIASNEAAFEAALS